MAAKADALTRAIDAVDAVLDRCGEDDPDGAVAALAQPVRAFDAVAKEALR